MQNRPQPTPPANPLPLQTAEIEGEDGKPAQVPVWRAPRTPEELEDAFGDLLDPFPEAEENEQ